jgi:hypothetical protein
MDNPETLSTLSTQNIGQINVRENREDNQEWTILRHMNNWAHKDTGRRQNKNNS